MATQHEDEFDSLTLDDDFVRSSTFKENKLRRKKRNFRLKPSKPSRRTVERAGKGVGIAAIVALCGLIGDQLYQNHQRNNATPAAFLFNGPAASTSSTSTTLSLEQHYYHPGDCIIWDQSKGRSEPRSTPVVPCTQPHLIEYVGTATINNDSASLPPENEMRDIINQLCRPEVESFLGYKLDDNGRFQPGAIQPSPEGWADGERTLDCGILITPTTANYDPTLDLPFSIEVKGADQHPPTPKGTCLLTNQQGQTVGSVDCSTPHQVEVTGTVNIADKTTTRPTSDAQWNSLVGAQCYAMAKAYIGKPLPSNLTSGLFQITQSSWDTGDRNVDCTIANSNGSANLTLAGRTAA